MDITTSNWGGNSRAIERGPLVYGLRLEEQWSKDTDEKEGDYFVVSTNGAWNYGLLDSVVKNPEVVVKLRAVRSVKDDFVWNQANAPLELRVLGRIIPDWRVVNDVAPQPVTARDGLYMGRTEGGTQELTLIPVGCTKVRIVAFPVVR